MKTLITSLLLTFTVNVSAGLTSEKSARELAFYLQKNKSTVLALATQMHEYTYYEFTIEEKNCVAKSSPIGAVGMCLVKGLASEENVIAYYSVNVTSDYSGTGDEERKISLTLIDYEL